MLLLLKTYKSIILQIQRDSQSQTDTTTKEMRMDLICECECILPYPKELTTMYLMFYLLRNTRLFSTIFLERWIFCCYM